MQIREERTRRPPPYGSVPLQIQAYVAGRYYYQGAFAAPGEPLCFVREPNNAFDPNAVMILNAVGELIGYLPYGLAAELAADLDAHTTILTGTIMRAAAANEYESGRPPLLLRIHPTDPSVAQPSVPGSRRQRHDFNTFDFDDSDDGDPQYVVACKRDMGQHVEGDEPEYFDYDGESNGQDRPVR